MLCEKCRKYEAKINLVTVINGQKHEVWLCESCVKDISNIPFLSSIGQSLNFPFQGMISEVLSNIDKKINIDNNKIKEIVCSNCGLTYDEFKKSEKLGCAQCYKEFKIVLDSKIKNLQADIKHIGKIPKVKGKDLVQKKKLKDLKREMQQLITLEKYEKAAIVRDEIRKLELNILESNSKETFTVEEENCNE